MNNMQSVVEYYDELYPSDESQRKFFMDILTTYLAPSKFLRIGCGTGNLESFLAKNGIDVTGLDTNKEILESANLRRRFPNMAIRFFQMSTIEMINFLGKNFYNVIACLNDKLIYIHDEALMKKFFVDCKLLLSNGGSLVLQLYNYNMLKDESVLKLPNRESIRSKIMEHIVKTDSGDYIINQYLENSNEKIIPLLQRQKVLPITPEKIKEFAQDAGFANIDFYEDYTKKPFTSESKTVVCVIS